jgi:hypothetical protein
VEINFEDAGEQVKAGTQGAMQSLRWFMQQKKIDKGIRTSLENFACYENIDVYPMYAISNLLKSQKSQCRQVETRKRLC